MSSSTSELLQVGLLHVEVERSAGTAGGACQLDRGCRADGLETTRRKRLDHSGLHTSRKKRSFARTSKSQRALLLRSSCPAPPCFLASSRVTVSPPLTPHSPASPSPPQPPSTPPPPRSLPPSPGAHSAEEGSSPATLPPVAPGPLLGLPLEGQGSWSGEEETPGQRHMSPALQWHLLRPAPGPRRRQGHCQKRAPCCGVLLQPERDCSVRGTSPQQNGQRRRGCSAAQRLQQGAGQWRMGRARQGH